MSRSNVLSKLPLFALALCLLIDSPWRSLHAGDAPAGKLVIVKAIFGELPNGAKADVTEKLAAMVKDNSVAVVVSSNVFGDIADGAIRKLQVDYTLDGVAHSRTAEEGEYLVIPGKPPRLIIRKAVYGDLPNGPKTDVTAQLQEAVASDTLSIEATNDNFGDPAFGKGKKLTVDYTFDGQDHSKTVLENETLTISDKGE
jgi:hypothetical protein